MIPVQAGKRGKGYFPEVRYSRGPRLMGETGDNSFRTLLGYLWMAVLDRAKGLRLFQAQVPGEGPWALDDPRGPDVAVWIEAEVPPLPHPARQVRHLAFCFDQAARHVVAYEYQGQVYVRQWDPVAGAYTMRGPFPGVDPVLLWDYEVGYFLGDSDVLLFHLSPDRTQVIMRVQRELYANPCSVRALPGPAYLDQALALPYQAEVLGSLDADPDTTSLVLRTDLYPVYLSEVAASPVVNAPVDWDYIPGVVVQNLLEVAGTTSVTAPTSWDYIFEGPPPPIIKDLGVEVAGVASVAAPTSWDYIFAPPWVLRDLGIDVAASASVTAPTNWNYPLAVVVYNGGAEVAASASVNAPTDWNYYV
jgi:hypothetical protein